MLESIEPVKRDTRRLHVIVNPVSGRRRHRRIVRTFLERVVETARSFRYTITRGPGDAARAAEAACRASADTLIVAGGDGTIREAASGMIGDGVPMLIVPTGTENVVAKHLGLRLDEDHLEDALLHGGVTPFDIGRCRGHGFLMGVGVGFDAEVVRRLALARKGHISYWSYVKPILGALLSFRPPRLHVETDGELLFEGRGQLHVGNISRYACGQSILRGASPEDGLLDACVLAYESRARLLWHAGTVLSGGHIGLPGVHYRQFRRLVVTSDEPAPVQIDGDAFGMTPVEIDLNARRVSLIVPA